MIAIKTENLTKKYKDVLAVDSLSLCIEEGELFSLLGINGAGKTTTVKMLSCLTEPTSGEAYLLERSIKNDSNEAKKLIAVSPQETAVAKGLSVIFEKDSFYIELQKFSHILFLNLTSSIAFVLTILNMDRLKILF